MSAISLFIFVWTIAHRKTKPDGARTFLNTLEKLFKMLMFIFVKVSPSW